MKMKKVFLLFITIVSIHFTATAQEAQTTQMGIDQNTVFEEHLITAFSLLALTADQENAIRNEINTALFDIGAINNNGSLNSKQKNASVESRNELKNRNIKAVMKEEKYTTWKKIRQNQNEMQDVPVHH